MDSHAQYEIRVMAKAMFDTVAPLFPLTADAFKDYILYAKTFSVIEQKVLRSMVSQALIPTIEHAKSLGLTDREYNEFTAWIANTQATNAGE